jgi:NADH-quinone oxidoreductase subunit M
MSEHLLTFVISLPLVGFLIACLLPKERIQQIRVFALGYSLITFVASLGLIAPFWHASPSGYVWESNRPWIDFPPIRYHMGLDGLSLWLVILTTFLTPLCVLISWNYIDKKQKQFYAFLLLLEFGLVGVFCALDLFLFYVFWELALVPMYFLVGIWGYSRRIYAAVKFFLYTMTGSVLMLVAIIYMYNRSGTFDYPAIMQMLHNGRLVLTSGEAFWMFLAFFFAFAIKVPLFPLHTWLPDAHVEAPTAGSVMLASVMLKMGTYGILRFAVPMFPATARSCAVWIVPLAIIGIIYGALVAMVQPNMKKLVAYSSVSHLGFVLYERRHSLEIADYGGVAIPAPNLAKVFMIAMLASIGLPMLNNFVGEYLVLQGAAIANFNWAVFAAIGVILAAVYMLWLYQRTFFGKASDEVLHHMRDLGLREYCAIVPLIVLMVWMGVFTQSFMPAITSTTARILAPIDAKREVQVKLEHKRSASFKEIANAR